MLLVSIAMESSTIKNLAWSLLVASAGGFALFWVFLIEHTFPRNRIYFFLVLCASAGVISIVHLRNAYRNEPFQWKGGWQIHVSELILILIISGGFLALFRAVWPAKLLAVGIPIVLVTAIMLTWGLLVGARKGLQNTKYKALYGIGWATWIYGMLGTGSFLVLLIFLTITWGTDNSFDYLIFVLFLLESRNFVPDWGRYIFQTGLVCLPIGILCLSISKRHLESSSKEIEP